MKYLTSSPAPRYHSLSQVMSNPRLLCCALLCRALLCSPALLPALDPKPYHRSLSLSHTTPSPRNSPLPFLRLSLLLPCSPTPDIKSIYNLRQEFDSPLSPVLSFSSLSCPCPCAWIGFLVSIRLSPLPPSFVSLLSSFSNGLELELQLCFWELTSAPFSGFFLLGGGARTFSSS